MQVICTKKRAKYAVIRVSKMHLYMNLYKIISLLAYIFRTSKLSQRRWLNFDVDNTGAGAKGPIVMHLQ